MPRRLVISAINFSEGGPLTILRQCLLSACAELPEDWDIVALVHDRRLFDLPRVKFVEFADSKRSWLKRLYYEYWYFGRLSRRSQPDVWLSLHDMTPRVRAGKRVVYCHNPSPFMTPGWKTLWRDPVFFLFTRFYRYLYRINIRANDLVIVQQDWIRKEFKRMFKIVNVAVAYPTIPAVSGAQLATLGRREIFLYPALPRSFKNFEVLCDAAELLCAQIGDCFEVRLTIAGNENAFAAYLYRRYGRSAVVKFCGRQSVEQMSAQYQEAGTIVFPSLLETWGLPISEGKAWGKPLLLADLPYAHETLGTYSRVRFFDPRNAADLAKLMKKCLEGEDVFDEHVAELVEPPFAQDWPSLIRMVTSK